MKKNCTLENFKTKSKVKEGVSQKTLDFLMLFARSYDIETEDKLPKTLDKVCLN